jgi:K+-transporting ATPase KdpF subunit
MRIRDTIHSMTWRELRGTAFGTACVSRHRFFEVNNERFRCLTVGPWFRRYIVVAHCRERRIDGRSVMNGTEVIGLVLSAGLLVYLVVALLKPEWFA